MTAATDTCALSLSSTVPPTSMRYPLGRLAFERRDLRRQCLHDGSGLRAGLDVGLHRHGWPAVATPDDRIFLAVFDGCELAEGHGLAVRQRHLKGSDRRQRHALFGGGADQHVHEIDSAAHLGGCDAGQDCVQGVGQILRAQAQKARLVLVDPDPDGPRRLHPIVVDVPGAWGRPDFLSDLERDRAHLLRLPSAHPVLKRPSDRRAEFQRVDPSDNAREFCRQRLLQPCLHPFALLQPFCHDHRLGEEVVWQLDVKRQIKPDRALPDIGAPVVHVRITLQELIHPGRGVSGCVDRSVLRQLQIHEQLRPVGRGEELLRHEAHAKQGQAAAGRA